jgi:hypothetical protein
MADSTALDASPTTLLSSVRGEIVAARVAYPDVLHVEIRDSSGGLWRLATQDADFTPSDPNGLLGARVIRLAIDPITTRLHCSLADGSALVINPGRHGAEDDPPNWELLTPDGLALEFGPGLRWQIARADAATVRA